MNEIMLDNSCLPVMSVCDLCAAPEDFYHADRTVDFHVMIYVVEGVVYVTEGDVDYEIHAGEMLFLKSGIRHRGKRAIERGTRWYFIHFYLEESGGIPAFSPDSSAPVPHVPVRLCACAWAFARMPVDATGQPLVLFLRIPSILLLEIAEWAR